ncbi:hypothetical protein KKC83_05805 [Patescibacteria group bacterium]|nr:hypothetical protein [Candidatus Falkowbacteria bacterium]MBU3906178.1 hypothetical protein [Patescibacteria group bacterium]MCG2698028.1 hypothetical protein [Candidatus Parcubacteria bacterium]MBU4015117.1 hypothetical protein [Patescibacteria group bacterium]MBU4027031.1 hypothetical protein [Patescibacteria group bacterium]
MKRLLRRLKIKREKGILCTKEKVKKVEKNLVDAAEKIIKRREDDGRIFDLSSVNKSRCQFAF